MSISTSISSRDREGAGMNLRLNEVFCALCVRVLQIGRLGSRNVAKAAREESGVFEGDLTPRPHPIFPVGGEGCQGRRCCSP